jgi:hypothetical protein
MDALLNGCPINRYSSLLINKRKEEEAERLPGAHLGPRTAHPPVGLLPPTPRLAVARAMAGARRAARRSPRRQPPTGGDKIHLSSPSPGSPSHSQPPLSFSSLSHSPFSLLPFASRAPPPPWAARIRGHRRPRATPTSPSAPPPTATSTAASSRSSEPLPRPR